MSNSVTNAASMGALNTGNLSFSGGGASHPGGVSGVVGAGVPIYTSPSGNFSASVGASTGFGPRGSGMGQSYGVGMRWKF